mmetsp:Transcript_34650/g.110046  ORF Transcript_34650/g.110046 Transcript_34650/m.110046 type:complete len:213 (-) Transcript_34650:513-1151(-)
MCFRRPSRCATLPTMAANSSSINSFAPSLPLLLRSPHSQWTSALRLRLASSWALTLVRSSAAARCWTSLRISARSCSRVKVSATPASSSGMPSTVPACANCSSRFTARASSSPSSGSTRSLISPQVTAQRMRFPPKPPARWPNVTSMSLVSPFVTPTSFSWISGRRPPFSVSPSSRRMPSAAPTSSGAPREPSGESSKPFMSTESTSPLTAW